MTELFKTICATLGWYNHKGKVLRNQGQTVNISLISVILYASAILSAFATVFLVFCFL